MKLQPNKCKPQPLFFIKCFGVDYRPIQMHSVLPVPPAAISANRMGKIARHSLIQWGPNGNPLDHHSMAPCPAKVSTSCFAASVALPAPDLARQWSESESHPNEPQALTQFLVLSHIEALLSSG